MTITKGNDTKELPVVELFGATIQGEGSLTGKVSYFVRLGGCGYRCDWCDSMHAVDPAQIKANATRMTQDQIAQWFEERVLDIPKNVWVTLSGGDPCMWDLTLLVQQLSLLGMKVAVETQGQIYQPWLKQCDLVTCSPKGPSSGMQDKIDFTVLNKYRQNLHFNKRYPGLNTLVFKVVCFNDEDVVFAENIHSMYPHIPLHLSVGTDPKTQSRDALESQVCDKYRWLADEVLKRPHLYDCTVGPQMHVLLFGHDKGK